MSAPSPFKGLVLQMCPTVTVLYAIEPVEIVIYNALFEEAKAFRAGRA
jgi:hypothetical protein